MPGDRDDIIVLEKKVVWEGGWVEKKIRSEQIPYNFCVLPA
jgi:hypothetical protein